MGLCAVVCVFLLLKLFLVVEGFSLSKPRQGAGERIQVTREKRAVKARSLSLWEVVSLLCDSLIEICVQDKGFSAFSLAVEGFVIN